MCIAVEFFPAEPGKSLFFPHFSPSRLWTNLWRMWKSDVEKGVENVNEFILCKLNIQ